MTIRLRKEEGPKAGALLALLHRLDRLFSLFSCIGVFTLMLLISADVIGRYMFNAPIEGVYEIIELYLMTAIVFLGFGLLQRTDGHVRIILIFELLPNPVKRWLDAAFMFIALMVFGVATVAASYLALDHFMAGRMEGGVVELPLGPSWLIVVLGLGFFCLRLAVQLTLCVLGKEYIEQREEQVE